MTAFAGPVAFCLVIAAFGVPTRYELHATELVIRSGILRFRVSYDNIAVAVTSHNVLSAPAWSLDRLRIDKVAGGYLLISPKDKHAFLEALQAHTPQLLFADGKLLFRGSSS